MTETASLVIKVDSSGADRATRNLRQLDRAADNTGRAAGRLKAAWAGAAAVIGSVAVAGATRAFIRQADAFANMSARLRLVTESGTQAAKVQRDLFELSQRTSTRLEDTTELYVRLAQASDDLRNNQERLFGITETVSKSMIVSGSSASEAASSVRQFSQAMASGVLRGDEFNSIMENSPRLARAIADGLQVPVGALRKMAEEGELTADRVIAAVESQSAAIDREFGKIPLTVSRATQQVKNALLQMIGTTDQAEGASRGLAESIADLARTLESQEVKDGFAAIVAGLVDVAAFAAKATTGIANFVRQAAEGLAVGVNGVSKGDIERQRAQIADYKQLLAQIREGEGRDITPTRRDQLGRIRVETLQKLAKAQVELKRNTDLFGDPERAAAEYQARFRGLPENNGLNVNPNGDAPPVAVGGDSDAAKKLQKAYESLSANMREQLALFGEVGEAAKVRYAIEKGELEGLSESKQRELIALAEQIDATQELTEIEAAWADESQRAFKIRQDWTAEVERGREATSRLIADMQFERDLLGMTRDERAKAIALRYADANATDAQREAIAELAVELEHARENEEVLDGMKRATSDLFADVISGSRSASDAFEDFADRMKQLAAQVLADKAVQALAAGFSSWMGGGTFWGGFSGSFTGGGRAGGGPVMAGQAYTVGEHGAELFVPNQNGRIVSADKGGGTKVVNNITIENAPAGSDVSQSQNSTGGMDIRVVLGNMAKKAVGEDIARGGDLAKVIGSRFGLAPVGVSRG